MSSLEIPPHQEDFGLAALIVIARLHGVVADATQIRHQSAIAQDVLTEGDLIRAAKSIGLNTKASKLRPERLTQLPFPVLVFDQHGRHFILAGCDGKTGLIYEVDKKTSTAQPIEEILERASGRLMFFTSRASLLGELSRFDFSWFIPAIIKYRYLLLEVLGISLVLQLFGLVTPLMFQVVMDKVLVNRTFSTLNVVCVALL